MYIKQSDIFWQMSKESIKSIMDKSRKETFFKGQILFEEGDSADFFYSLVKGSVRLRIRKAVQTIYTVNRAGEAFGWSSLVGREFYTASAETTEASTLMVFEKDHLLETLTQYPHDGLIFFRQLALTLSNRLVQSYEIISSAYQAADFTSHGTGQVQEAPIVK